MPHARRPAQDRNPTRNHGGRVRIRTGFAHAEAETHQQQNWVTRDRAGQRRERRPPQHDSGQHAPWTDAIAECASGDLEGAVGNEEDAGDPAPRLRTDVQIVLHPRSGHGDADAVDVRDDRQQGQESEDAMLVFHGSASF
jgi:hypothetical protein